MLDKAAVALEAKSVGTIARAVISPGAVGQVVAVFKRSFYLGINGERVCVGPSHLGKGPLNLLYSPAVAFRQLRVGDLWRSQETTISIGNSLQINWSKAEIWVPQATPQIERVCLQAGLALFDQAIGSTRPSGDGLGLLLPPDGEMSAVAVIAQPAVTYLRQFLSDRERGHRCRVEIEKLAPLLGLGPGLTPSGDDYLVGALVALHAAQRGELAFEMFQALGPLLSKRTTAISAAYLASATLGYGSAALHDLICDICSGGTFQLQQKLNRLLCIGHTSGSDALAGAICVLRILASEAHS